ncbi:hypothetical protein B0J18DRAFT_426461 [Chaetomium sp. MPI-SDFR-AT-0129]|nr:hypothetical protein B0J18DRAFT_426461 [Chaetomium sp. MPI-SDFR-AT-0129]
MLSKLKSAISPPPPRKAPIPIKTTYTSLPISLPPSFLTTPPPDALPITITPIPWPQTPLPEYAPLYATVLDNVLSPSECAQLLRLVESTVPPLGAEGAELRRSETDPWMPALVNVGGGFEVLEAGYRNGERIVWDCQEVVDRVWERCVKAEGGRLKGRFERIEEGERDLVGYSAVVTGARKGDGGEKARRRVEGGAGGEEEEEEEAWWEFLRVNERMRFLRYGKGGFFRPHCDSPYRDNQDPSRRIVTMFTIHLYLNDSKAEVPGADLVGGATTFFSNDEKRRLDVHPKAGRVLIFQHRRLLHSGDDVLAGTKYTMRTDIMYEFKIRKKRRGNEEESDVVQ